MYVQSRLEIGLRVGLGLGFFIIGLELGTGLNVGLGSGSNLGLGFKSNILHRLCFSAPISS